MRCPKCGQPEFYCGTPCPDCNYQAEPRLLERLSNLRFLLSEIEKWSGFPPNALERLRDTYNLALRNTERELGLRAPILGSAQARQARQELWNVQNMLVYLPHWVKLGVIAPQQHDKLESELREKAFRLDISLADAPATPTPTLLQQTLDRQRYRLASIQEWHTAGYIKSEPEYEKVVAELNSNIEEFEIRMGLRQAPEPIPQQPAAPATPRAPSRAVTGRLKLPRLSREQLVETLLSERTLQAILFLGATLLFAAAVSLVVWNWDAFPPWLQVTFLALNTGLFYFLGWYARSHMNLRGSGITLSAVASLLVPLDFYAIYLSRGFPPQLWPQVWMVASLICLGAYLLTAYMLQAEFFGYLVGLAAGSTLAAAMQLGGIHMHAWQAGLSALALALGLVAEGLLGRKASRWSLLAMPLWRISLVGISVILLLASGWLLSRRVSGEIYRAALALDWWLAGALFVLAVRRYPGRMLALLAGGSFPVALVFSQEVLFNRMNAVPAWHALGLALLVPVYLFVGRQLSKRAADAVSRPALRFAYARTALGYAVALAVAAALWSLFDPRVAALVHPLLAGVVALATVWWERPRLAYLSSLLLLSGSTAVVASRGAALAQIGLAWSLVAILHVIAAIRLEGRYSRTTLPDSTEKAYAAPVYAAGWLIAGLALLPPLFMRERGILTYTLGNWIAINGWLALQAASQKSAGLQAWLSGTRLPLTRRRLSPLLFHWSAALPLLPWLWLAWTNHNMVEMRLGWLYALLGWGALFLGNRLVRSRRSYETPWYLAAHLAVPLSIFLVFIRGNEGWTGAALLLGAAFFFSAARLLRRRVLLFIGGVFLALGWVSELYWIGLVTGAQLVGAAFLPLAYEIIAHQLAQRRLQRDSFYQPLRAAAQVIAAVVFIRGLLWISADPSDNNRLLWAAGASLLLSLYIALHSWLSFEKRGNYGSAVALAHLAAWMGVLSGGLVAAAYSRGSGRSASAAALLAVVYILTERWLYWAATHRELTHGWLLFTRKAWRLFHRPLLVTGWAVTVITIVLAMWRNLVILGGGRDRETWSILALLLVTALYALSARLFRRQNYASQFVWFAAFLFFIPWTLLTHQGWYLLPPPAEVTYALSWALLALVELLVGVILAKALQPDSSRWSLPPMLVAHLILPFALFWGSNDNFVSSISLGLGVLFYLLAVWIDTWFSGKPLQPLVPPVLGGTPLPAPREILPDDRRRASGEGIHAERGYKEDKGNQGSRVRGKNRFLYPAVFLVPIWAIYLLNYFAPGHSQDTFAWLMMAFPLPALYLGRRLEYRWRAQIWPAYQRPLYRVGYTTSLLAILMAAYADRLTLISALLLATLVASLAAWMFRQPRWLFPACAAFAGAAMVAGVEWHLAFERQGWVLIAVSGLYLLLARQLQGIRSQRDGHVDRLTYTSVLQICALVLIALALPYSSLDRLGAALGYGSAAALCVLLAFWLRQPVLLTPGAFLAAVPYAMGVLELRQRSGWLGDSDLGLVAWPGILLLFALAVLLDRSLGIAPDASGRRPGSFPWGEPVYWPAVLLNRLWYWWALPLYTLALGGAAVSMLLTFPFASKLALDAALTAGIFLLAAYYFRLRIWLLAALGAAQISLLSVIVWLAPNLDAGQVVLTFAPVVWLTALLGLSVQHRLAESNLLTRRWFWGWSRPFYLIVALDLWFGQILSFLPYSASRWITLSHALLLSMLASAWSSTFLAYLSPLVGILALIQHLSFIQAWRLDWPPALALLGLIYGVGGYLLSYFSVPEPRLPDWLGVWQRPLKRIAWGLSVFSLVFAFFFGTNVFALAFRAIFSLPLLTPLDLWRVHMDVSVLSLVGLLVLTAAVVERRRRLGYTALALLLLAWSLELLLVWGWREFQWYAIPAGLYLLSIGFLEWTRGGRAARNLARWVDRAALLLLLGSAFWQSLGPQGWRYALLMGLESLLILWWGSARRMRRFLYAGVIGMTLDVAGQLVEPLLSANRWIVFGVAGVLLVGLAMLVERRLDALVSMSQEMRARLERWQ